MSHDYNQAAGIFSFSNGFDRSAVTTHHDQHHIAQQIRRDKLRVQGGFEPPPPPLVGIDEEESGGLQVYETAGMLSEMFNFPSGSATAAELLDQPMPPSFRSPRPPSAGSEWYGSRQGMVGGGLGPLGDSKNQSSRDSFTAAGAAGGAFGQFTWVPDHEGGTTATAQLNNPNEIGGELWKARAFPCPCLLLQHLEAAKAEEFRIGESGLLYYNQAGGGGSTAGQYPYKNLSGHSQAVHLQGGGGVAHQNHHHQVHVGFGSSLGVVNVLRNSKHVKAAQELLEEFCSVGRGQFKKNKFSRQNTNPSSNPVGSTGGGGGGGGSSSSSKDVPPMSAADRIEHQRRKVKLLSMLDEALEIVKLISVVELEVECVEVDRRYNHYCEQMQMVVNSFDLDAISAQLKHSCELLGEKDGAGSSGITKGETPRLKMLEQSLRQQHSIKWARTLMSFSGLFLRYPSDADKHLLARQTGLSRNQVSNWFINARVRLWKPMVEEMYQQETKEEDTADEREIIIRNVQSSSSGLAQTSTPTATAATPASTTTTPPASSATTPTPTSTTTATTTTTMPTGKRSDFNAPESDPSLVAINRQAFSENQATHHRSPRYHYSGHHHSL
ncbi:hypothetical protein FNV43_RR19074 [Rhamnella rubrinervis]|uniref:Homeobox domain-containing protein n=1 Tax=Rhamnella rubrinervis TaxID=2594499 RepID=A0A8K0GWW9_9ROSA|nr:hypothetical protein FNV43_RR19074 [Rhamnella rubrinervis]